MAGAVLRACRVACLTGGGPALTVAWGVKEEG